VVTARLFITEERAGNVTILRLSGRFELDDGDVSFRNWIDRLVAEGRVWIVLDLARVTRIDSAGIGMLVSKFLSARKRGGTIKLLHLTAHSGHLLHITKLNAVFEMFQDEVDAVRSFGVGT
jgi:anti-sigma B factor antagonist